MKGVVQTLEAVIAVILIMVVVVTYYGPKEKLPEFETISWKLSGFDALKALDASNELRQYVLANDTATIESKLLSILYINVNYQILVCDSNCGKPNINSDKITSVTYLIAGDVNNIKNRQVVLYIWG